jgi:hypothetical protein
MEELIGIAACVAGCVLVYLIDRKRDIWSGTIGIAMGLSVAFAVLEKNPLYLLVLISGVFLVFRRRTRER